MERKAMLANAEQQDQVSAGAFADAWLHVVSEASGVTIHVGKE